MLTIWYPWREGGRDGQRAFSLTTWVSLKEVPRGEKFIGHAAKANPLEPKRVFKPEAVNMHQDGGNTGTVDYPGPLGVNLNVSNNPQGSHIPLWTKSGQLITGYADTSPTGVKWGLAALDSETQEVQATWYPEIDGQTFNVAYMELVWGTDRVVVTTKESRVYTVELSGVDGGKPRFEQVGLVDLTKVLGDGELLLNGMYDTDENLWFTSGGIRAQGGRGDEAQNSTTIGYVEPKGTIHALHIPDQMVENGIAVTGKTAYVVTGPSGNDDHADAIGHLHAFGPGSGSSITTLWTVPYEAGGIQKPGAFARGSGASPALLGDDYVAITDNAKGKVNLNIYHQKDQKDHKKQTVCSVPLFKKGGSNVDIAALTHREGDTYGVFLCNDYNAPPLTSPGSESNGHLTTFNSMVPGVVRVDVAADGSSCKVAWEIEDLPIQSVPIISTKNGLLYGYTQTEKEAQDDDSEWYAIALDWRTGKEAWRVRTGAGDDFNDNYQPGILGPDGSFYQGVNGGVIRVKDGSS